MLWLVAAKHKWCVAHGVEEGGLDHEYSRTDACVKRSGGSAVARGFKAQVVRCTWYGRRTRSRILTNAHTLMRI